MRVLFNPDPSDPAGGGKTTPAADPNLIPKSDLDRALAENKATIQSLKQSLEDAQTKLLDPKYLSYLQDQDEPGKKKLSKEAIDASGLPSEVQDLLRTQEGRVKNIEAALTNISAVLELQEVERRYTDFNNYREDVRSLLSQPGSENLTIEQAYKLVKSDKAPTPADKGKPAPKGNEKPSGTLPTDDGKKKVFANAAEAGKAAADEVWERHGLTGDII